MSRLSRNSIEATEPRPARFHVGIDLGTTNSALASIDSNASSPRLHDLAIPQVTAPGEVDVRPVLPSFCYEPVEGEFQSGALNVPGIPGGGYVIGWFARRQGTQTPGRLVASAKSWLCHPGVDRTAALLPWHGAPDVTRISPVEASARYLSHLRAAWDATHPTEPFAAQDVVITVPASFDEVARQLTLRAAEKAGLPKLTLIEEPQAAFYAWMAAQGAKSEDASQAGQLTLVCDVGGGTTDFTLIEARSTGDGRVRFHRVAVGNHLILGGDNMDLALAHHLEARLTGGPRLDPRRWSVLVQASRQAKETLLGPGAPERVSLSVAGGARLVGGSLQTEVTRDEVIQCLVDGFFPRVSFREKAATARSGFQEFGLPYAADPAITRHLAEFLSAHVTAAGFPTQVLFNGGVFESAFLQQRVVEVLDSWRREAGSESTGIRILPHDRLDLAVARGAAYAAWLRRQPGRRITSGLARAYYIAVGHSEASEPMAVCLAPAGLEEGQEIVIPQRFVLRLRQPVEFGLYSSATRLTDKPGDIVVIDPAILSPLPPIRTVVSARRSDKSGADSAEVRVHSRLTEIGTLDVRCVALVGERSWKLEFDVRAAASPLEPTQARESPKVEALEEDLLRTCVTLLRRVFPPAQAPHDPPAEDPAGLMKRLEGIIGAPRDAWPLPLLRTLWDELMDVEPGRRRGVLHEARWLNLLGFALRPGFGYTVDDWRVQQTWKLAPGGTVFPKNEMCRAEWCILWRRIAGGLTAAHQRALADPFTPLFRAKPGRKVRHGAHELSEIWRLLGSLELLPVPLKVELGNHLMESIGRKLEPSLARSACWTIGRLGARVPVHGPLNALVPTEVAEQWLAQLILRPPPDPDALFAAVQMARPTGDRYRDVAENVRTSVIEWLGRHGASEQQIHLAREGGALDTREEERVLGESLPPGLHWDQPVPSPAGAAGH